MIQKVGILCTMINGFGRRGYYNSQEIGLGRALASRGADVHIYKGIPKTEAAAQVVLQDNLRVDYIPMQSLGAHGFFDCRMIDTQLSGLFCFGDQQIFLPHIYRFCRKRGIVFVPYIGTAHSLHSSVRSWVMNTLFAYGTLKIYRKHPVIAKTEAAKNELINLGVKDVTVAPVGLDTEVLRKDFRKYDRGALRKKHGISSKDVVICNVSRLSPEKRPLELIDILASIKKKKTFKLIIVGDGELREQLREKIRSLRLEGDVIIYPNVPYEDMWEIYTLSDYYLNLNKGEIFGMAIMEAVYYETSVAAIAALGPSVTLKGMRGHKICENDEELVRWLLSPYPSKEELMESSLKMEKTFTWERCAKSFLEIVKRQTKEFL